jgi:hypothetical protein
MTDANVFSDLKKAIDNLSKALDDFYKELPKYLRAEILNPKEKTKRKHKKSKTREV